MYDIDQEQKEYEYEVVLPLYELKENNMRRIEDNFVYKGVTFKVINRGQKALMLEAKADFYTCPSVEVWQIRYSKESVIKGNVIPAGERKPSNEDYPYCAHQFMQSHFNSYEDMMIVATKRFNEYELGIRPKSIELKEKEDGREREE